MKRVAFPATRVANFATWIVEHAIAIEFALRIKLSLVFGSIGEIEFTIWFIIKDICSNYLYLWFWLKSDWLGLFNIR